MQPSVPSARNVRGGVIVRVRGHHPPVSSLLRRDVLVIFVSERVLADEFALTSLEVPAREPLARLLFGLAGDEYLVELSPLDLWTPVSFAEAGAGGDPDRMARRKALYESYVFQPLPSNPTRLFLSLNIIRELLAEL